MLELRTMAQNSNSDTRKATKKFPSKRRRASSDIKCIYPRKVESDMVNLLPITSYKGVFDLIEDDAHLDIAIAEIMEESILGFDTETRPNFTKNKHYQVSILQLGGRDKVWIIRLEPLKHRLSDIYEILENPAIKKVGIAVHGDILSLKERLDFSPAGFEDIARYTRAIGVINTGMKNLAALILGERISKSAQLTNWASDNLTKKQLEYAATDAWISRRLYITVKDYIENTNIGVEPEVVDSTFNIKNFVSKIIKKISIKLPTAKKPSQKKKRAPKKQAGEKRVPTNTPRVDKPRKRAKNRETSE